MYLRPHPLKNDLVVDDGEGATYITGAAAARCEPTELTYVSTKCR